MLFKSLNIDTAIPLKFNDRSANSFPIRSKIREIESFSDEWVVFSINIPSNPARFGVREKMTSEEIPLDERLGDDQLIDIRFVAIDARSSTAFYDGNKEDVKRVLEHYFDFDNVSLRPVVDVDSLQAITEIKIIERLEGQMSMDDIDSMPETPKLIEGLFEPYSFSEVEYKVSIKDNRKFFSQDISKFITDNNRGYRRVYLEGHDDHQNEIIFDDVFSKKITILKTVSGWMQKSELKLSEIKHSLKQKI